MSISVRESYGVAPMPLWRLPHRAQDRECMPVPMLPVTWRILPAGQAGQNSGGQLCAVACCALHQLQVCAGRAPDPVQQLRLGERA